MMQTEQITQKEAIIAFVSFVLGSTLIIGIGGEAKNDSWIAGIIACIAAIPMLLTYARITALFPGKDLFDILEELLGKIGGKIISIIYTWYAFHLGALVIHNFAQFIKTVALPETPILLSMMALGLLCIYVVILGIEVLARTSAYFFPLLFFMIIIVQFFAIPIMDFDNLKPILGNGWTPILKNSFVVFTLPFAESVLFLGVFSSLKSKTSPYKVYIIGLICAAILIITLSTRNILILGSLSGSVYFPSHIAVSMISIGDFIQRIEVTVAIVLVFNVFIKSAICLLVACKGISKIFNLQDYRSIVIQTGLLMIYLSYFVYDNIMMMFYWAFKVYPYYALPVQVVLPIGIWIIAEIKTSKANKLKPAEA